MNLQISFKHMVPSRNLRQHVRDKSESLAKYFDGKIHLTWTLSHEKENRIAHLHLVGNHMDYFGEAVSEDFFASIDMALDKVERQIRKHKEIVKDRLHRQGHRLPHAG